MHTRIDILNSILILFQFPHLIDKSIQEGIQQMYSMLENHIVK